MQTREVSVRGRSVYSSGDTQLVRTSVGVDQMHVIFDSAEWVNFGAISVTFKNSEDADNPITTSITPASIDSPDWSAEATCVIPWEVIQNVGTIAITFQGVDSSSNHIITARAENVLTVVEAGVVDEGTVPSTAPTQSEWEQAYADAMAAASNAADAAEQISDILGSTDAQTLEELIAALGSALRYKGSVSTYADLPEDAEQGDTYNVAAAYGDYPAGTNWAWTGTQWDALGGEIDLSQFATKDVATTSADGLMSATDKAKLNGVEAGANNYTLPVASASTLGGVKVGTGLAIDANGVLSIDIANGDGVSY